MKILFVSMVAFENNTSATIRNKGIIKGLSELGCDIDIMTLKPSENSISYDDSMNDIKTLINKAYYLEINPKYAILMAKKDNYKNGKNVTKKNLWGLVLKRVRAFIKKIYDSTAIYDAQKFNVKQVSKIKIDYSQYDIIISASDPKSSHLIVERIYRENHNCKAKWIQYWGDPMFNDITRKRDWRDGLVKYHEKKLINKSDRVVYASPLTLSKQKDTFPEMSSKMDYASQVYANFSKNKPRDKESSEVNEITIGYFGAYTISVRNIMPLYNVARMGHFYLNICGVSDIFLDSTNNITVYRSVPYKTVLKMEEESDVLVCICNSRGTQIPGKIYYCAGYKKPIIVVLDSEYKEELKQHFRTFDRYILCENNEESIINAIEEAKEQLNKCEYRINEQLTPEYMGRKILGKFKDLVG